MTPSVRQIQPRHVLRCGVEREVIPTGMFRSEMQVSKAQRAGCRTVQVERKLLALCFSKRGRFLRLAKIAAASLDDQPGPRHLNVDIAKLLRIVVGFGGPIRQGVIAQPLRYAERDLGVHIIASAERMTAGGRRQVAEVQIPFGEGDGIEPCNCSRIRVRRSGNFAVTPV